MSITDVSVEPNAAAVAAPSPSPPAAARSGAARGTGVAAWARVALACALLAASGGVRWWQARRVAAALREGRTSPFKLDDLPMTLGDWRGEATTMDPKIARRTGATDLITRTYVDQRTGAAVEAIILYGPSTEVYGHVPEVCYKTAGFEKIAGPDPRTIHSGGAAVPFRSLVYSKGEGGQADLHEVYYSWRYSDHWSPDVIGTYKRFERIPGMLKVHLARHVTDRERRDIGNPCEALLQVLVPELERRLAAALSPTPSSSKTETPARTAEGRTR